MTSKFVRKATPCYTVHAGATLNVSAPKRSLLGWLDHELKMVQLGLHTSTTNVRQDHAVAATTAAQ